MFNNKTITYQVIENGFKYNMKEGRLLKGATISKEVHPLSDVNSYLKKLIKNRKVIDKGNYYVLKDNLKVGMLMAYNLHHGKLKTRLDNEQNIVVNSIGDKDIKDAFALKNIVSTDNEFINRLRYCELKLTEIHDFELNDSFFLGSSPDEFSPIEQLVAKVLEKNDLIKKYRHGIANNRECDIVIENEKRQIEIITEYKNKIKNRGKLDKDVLLLGELIDTNLISPSNAIISKLYKKNYTSKYEKELAVFCIGTHSSILTMLNQLNNYIKENGNVKNDYKKLYIIGYDFDSKLLYFYNSYKYLELNADEYDIKLFNKFDKINYDDLLDDKKYYIKLQNIFDKTIYSMILTGKEIKNHIKKLAVIK